MPKRRPSGICSSTLAVAMNSTSESRGHPITAAQSQTSVNSTSHEVVTADAEKCLAPSLSVGAVCQATRNDIAQDEKVVENEIADNLATLIHRRIDRWLDRSADRPLLIRSTARSSKCMRVFKKPCRGAMIALVIP